MFHHELRNGPFCSKPLDHKGKHEGHGLKWQKEPVVDAQAAAKFIEYYRRIPNSNHEIWLNDDGTVSMTLGGFWAATAFISTMHSTD